MAARNPLRNKCGNAERAGRARRAAPDGRACTPMHSVLLESTLYQKGKIQSTPSADAKSVSELMEPKEAISLSDHRSCHYQEEQ